MSRIDTYKFGALFYDSISGERLIYRAGRVAGIELLDLRRGDVVLDVGCGTGLNFPLLTDAVGPGGLVVGLDSSRYMLAVAKRHIKRKKFHNAVLKDTGHEAGVDTVFASYALRVIPKWRAAWSSSLDVLKPGGQVGVVDMQLPTGRASLLSPLARLACWMGDSDIHARPWTAVETGCVDVTTTSVRGGHIVAAVGRPAS